MNYYRIAQHKYKKAVDVSKILRYVPGIRMIAVCNSLSYNRATEESDIDLFIITRARRIWTTRFFCVGILKLLHERPHSTKTDTLNSKNKICLSFFVTENNMGLEKYKLGEQDPYLAFWIREIKPLYDEGMYKKFIEKNAWAFNPATKPCVFVPNYMRRVRKSVFKYFLDRITGNRIEKIFKSIQLNVMPCTLRKMAYALDSKVVISDSILKFHTNDRREYYNEQMTPK
jgi:predicted nucleotidyltransferase